MKKPEEIKKGLECCVPKWVANHWKTCDNKCPYVGMLESCRGQLTYDSLALIEQLEAKVPKWISVENPPQVEGEYIVIVQTADGKKERMWDVFHPNHGWCEDGEGNKVLFWMSFDSLPEPPKEG